MPSLATLLTLPMALLLMCSQAKQETSGNEAVSSDIEVARDEAGAPSAVQSVQFTPPQVDGSATSAQPIETQKILIKNGSLGLQVDSVDAALRQAIALAKQQGGRPGNEERSGGTGYQTITAVLFVPAERFDVLLQSLTTLGEVQNRTVSVDDLTEEFVDNNARLKSLKQLEARYLELVSSAKKVSEMLDIEEKLESVRSRIEQVEGRQRYLSQNAKESRITLTLSHQATQSTGFFSKLTDSLKGGWDLLLSLILGIAYLWPLAIVALLALALVRALRRKKKV